MKLSETIRLAIQYYQSGDLKQAEKYLQSALEQQPENPEILYFFGIVNTQLKNYDLAEENIKKSLRFNSLNSEAYLALGIVLHQKGMAEDAMSAFQKSLNINPNNSEAHHMMGNILEEKGLIDEAILSYHRAIQINAQAAEPYIKLGNIFHEKEQFDDAIAYFQKVIKLNPNLIQAYHGLAASFVSKWQLTDAINICNDILRLNPSDIFAYYILGNIMMTQGKLSEAEIFFKRAIQIKPDELKPYQALLMLLSYDPKNDIKTIFSEHIKFSKQFEEPLKSKILPHANERSLNKRLKICYVSPDFRKHSVAYFIAPILLLHNKDLFEIFCYSDVAEPDEMTYRLKRYSNGWLEINSLSNEKVDELIRKEGIDILVDLASHTGAKNRMLLFARKPAPIQVSWIGYPTTTGLSAIDYKIVDEHTNPEGLIDQFYSEKLMKLPKSFLCYHPDKDIPQVNTLPVVSSGHITFGSFNNFVKVVPEVIKLWAKILGAIPKSRLILKSLSFNDATTRAYAENLFIRESIHKERVDFLPYIPLSKDHLSLYNKIDIGLDTFPYNGTTTTCEALWMGVPVITLAGNTPASRVGLSLLSNVGLPELIAKNHDEYVKIAIDLAADMERLQSLRKLLRDMIKQSPLTDAKGFTVNLESCYRKMWETWCKIA